MVIQRPIDDRIPKLIEEAQSYGISVVVDIDDDFDRLDSSHSFYQEMLKRAHIVHECCKRANLVTTSTPGLLEQYGYGHGVTIPNYIPESMLSISREEEHEGLWLGWTGTIRSHPKDLQVIGNGVRKALEDNPSTTFVVIGPKEGITKACGIKECLSTGFVSLENYPKAYSHLDVGIVPLNNTRFNDHKSALKFLEASALGIPAVVSPSRENKKFHELSVGFLAYNPGDWRRHCSNLLRNEGLRLEMGQKAKEVASTLTIEQHCGQWMEAWMMALLNIRQTV